MGPDAASRDRVADHQVVEAGVGYEVESAQQALGLGQEVVDRLHQQGPLRFRQALEARLTERAMVELPVCAAALDQARLDVLAPRQVEQPLGRQQPLEPGQGIADQQRTLVPVVTKKAGGTESA